jgi:DNA-directed RNA polymerase subunit RPC12/RpoP
MNVICPRCQQEIDCSDYRGGESVGCPRCSQQFVVPLRGLVEVPMQGPVPPHLMQQAPQSPLQFAAPQSQPIIIHTGSRHSLPRLKPTGWFANAFGTTLGIVLGLIIVPIFLCGGLLLLGGVMSAVSTPTPSQRRESIATPTPVSKVTAANFSRIRTGMSVDEVSSAIGEPNEILNEIEIAGTRTVSFGWTGDRGGRCSVTFQDGVVAGKFQVGLK